MKFISWIRPNGEKIVFLPVSRGIRAVCAVLSHIIAEVASSCLNEGKTRSRSLFLSFENSSPAQQHTAWRVQNCKLHGAFAQKKKLGKRVSQLRLSFTCSTSFFFSIARFGIAALDARSLVFFFCFQLLCLRFLLDIPTDVVPQSTSVSFQTRYRDHRLRLEQPRAHCRGSRKVFSNWENQRKILCGKDSRKKWWNLCRKKSFMWRFKFADDKTIYYTFSLKRNYCHWIFAGLVKSVSEKKTKKYKSENFWIFVWSSTLLFLWTSG